MAQSSTSLASLALDVLESESSDDERERGRAETRVRAAIPAERGLRVEGSIGAVGRFLFFDSSGGKVYGRPALSA